jgi:hypothetical protein
MSDKISLSGKILLAIVGTRIGNYLANRIAGPLNRNIERNIQSIAAKISPQTSVQDGLFKGLKYPGVRSYGSTILPKLAGTYELVIQEQLQKLLDEKNYTTIIDIGCAEGYYAVGMALMQPEARVIAYDIAILAQALCAEMAELNGVRDRIEIAGECKKESLKSINPNNERILVICDCEGGEYELIKPENFISGETDFIIELHDDSVDKIKNRELAESFGATHDVFMIKEKAKDPNQFASLEKLSSWEKAQAIDESRPFFMEWMALTTKNPTDR